MIFLKYIMLFVMGLSLLSSVSTSFGEVDAIIFDCDGVLVDTEYIKFQAWRKALEGEGILLSLDDYKRFAGHSSKKILELLSEMKGVKIDENVISIRRDEYKKLQEQGVKPFPEMIKIVNEFSENRKRLGIKVGLVSSAPKEEILVNLRQIGLENAFDVIVSGGDDLGDYEDAEGKNKPKPYIYLEAAKRLGVKPARCLVYEDTEAGVVSGKSAGMIVIAVPNWMTDTQDFSKANKVIRNISELNGF
jgi:HAD superfamily hydrolase (TIGR01509 family)